MTAACAAYRRLGLRRSQLKSGVRKFTYFALVPILFHHSGEWNNIDPLLLHPGNHLFERFERGGMGVANPDCFPCRERIGSAAPVSV